MCYRGRNFEVLIVATWVHEGAKIKLVDPADKRKKKGLQNTAAFNNSDFMFTKFILLCELLLP